MNNDKNTKFSLLIQLFTLLFVLLSANKSIYALSTAVPYCENSKIVLISDPAFGVNTDWETLFYDTYKEFTVGPQGNIFVSNNRQHNVFIFSSSGKLITRFGGKGEGPGDLYYPGNISILDDKYLIIGQYASTRRISVFNLDGSFVKILKTKRSAFSPIALKDNRIAYFTISKSSPGTVKILVFTKSLNSGRERQVTGMNLPNRNLIRTGGGGIFMINNQMGHIVINRTEKNNLLVGASNTDVINIFSPFGKHIRSFRLNLKPIPVSDSYIRKFKHHMIEDAQNERNSSHYITALKKTNFKNFFADHFPLYRDIFVDSNGNLLVAKWLDCIKDCPKTFQAYSSEGKFLCDFKLNTNKLTFKIDPRRKHLILSKSGIFGLFQIKNSDDISLRLVKLHFNTATSKR